MQNQCLPNFQLWKLIEQFCWFEIMEIWNDKNPENPGPEQYNVGGLTKTILHRKLA